MNFRNFLLISLFLLTSCGNGSDKSDSNLSYDRSGFVEVSSVISDVIYDIRYYSTYNFVGKRISGYKANRAFLTKEAANALKRAGNELRKRGYRIVIYDAYRPQKAVDMFVKWMADENDKGNKNFYPNISNKNELIKGNYVATKSGHTRGSTVDISIVHLDGTSVDMGGTFDLFDKISNRDYKNLTDKQKKNRKLLEKIMVDSGFVPFKSEWWHFSLKNEPFPNTYFDFNVE